MADIPQPAPLSDNAVAFSIDKVYVKDLSLECPGSPQSFKAQEQPNVEVGLRSRGEQIETDIYECVCDRCGASPGGYAHVPAVAAVLALRRGISIQQLDHGVSAMLCPACVAELAPSVGKA